MFEFFGGLFFTYLVTWPALAILFVLGILFEHGDHRGFAVFVSITSIVAAVFYAGVTGWMIPAYVGAFLLVGMVWSVWRYKRHVDEAVDKMNKLTRSKDDRERLAAKLLPAAMWDTIVAWVFVWPFSFVEYFVRDAIDFVSMVLRKVFKGVYNRIYDSAIAKLGL